METDLFLTLDGRCRIQDGSRLSFSPSGGCDQGILNQGRQARAGGMIWRDYNRLKGKRQKEKVRGEGKKAQDKK
jgi:hypothetical protein